MFHHLSEDTIKGHPALPRGRLAGQDPEQSTRCSIPLRFQQRYQNPNQRCPRKGCPRQTRRRLARPNAIYPHELQGNPHLTFPQNKTTSTAKTPPQDPTILIDLKPLFPTPKIVPPTTSQLPNESRRFWSSVTTAILSKQYAQATKVKQELEERQREKAAERKDRGDDWRPRFFTAAVTPLGKPELTRDGKRALEGLQRGEYALEESVVTGA